MGQIIEIKCSKCGYRESANIGQGIRYKRLENVVNLFDEQTKDKINKTVTAGNSIWSAYREIGECRKCKRIVGTTVFTVTDEQGKKTALVSKCSCGNELRIIDSEKVLIGQQNVKCSKCGGNLEAKEIGRWD